MKKEEFRKILKNSDISVLPGGDSKRVFLVRDVKEKFVLRKFEDTKTRTVYEKLCKRLKNYDFLPKVYFAEGKTILFEYIEGRDCKKSDALLVAEQIGSICAYVNSIKPMTSSNRDQDFLRYANKLRTKKVITLDQMNELISTYHKLKTKLKPKLVMDANDVYSQNFRLRKGKVYFVDIEAIMSFYKGQGIAKGFRKFFKTNVQQKKFLKGYEKVSSTNFLTEDYWKFLNIVFLARSLCFGLIFDKELREKDFDKLKQLMKW